MTKTIKLEQARTDISKFELWKLNRRGYFNFLSFCDKNELGKITKKYKDYKIINKI